MENKNLNLPNCYACKFFHVTWQPDYPYGCEAFSMKSKKLPSKEVFRKSGLQCLYFEKKDVSPLIGPTDNGKDKKNSDEAPMSLDIKRNGKNNNKGFNHFA